LLELKRVTRCGGRIYITVADKHTVDLYVNDPEKIEEGGLPSETASWFRNLLLYYDKKKGFNTADYYMPSR
jgi:hypothetical protein